MDHMLVEIDYKQLPPEYVRCQTERQADAIVQRFAGRFDVRCVYVHEPRRVAYQRRPTA